MRSSNIKKMVPVKKTLLTFCEKAAIIYKRHNCTWIRASNLSESYVPTKQDIYDTIIYLLSVENVVSFGSLGRIKIYKCDDVNYEIIVNGTTFKVIVNIKACERLVK